MKPCPQCGGFLIKESQWACKKCRSDIARRDKWVTTPAQSVGAMAFLCGLGAAIYFLAFFDPTVGTSIGRVNNIGLLADRQNGLIVGGIVAMLGMVLMVLGGRKR